MARASEALISFWLIACLIVSGGVATIIIASYVGLPVDVNYAEASILYNKVMECVSDGNFLKTEVFADNFDLKKLCKLNENIDNSFYFEMKFLNQEGVEIGKKVFAGNTAYPIDCEVISGKKMDEKAQAFPNCYYRNESFLFIDKNENLQKIKVVALSASNNQGERVSG